MRFLCLDIGMSQHFCTDSMGTPLLNVIVAKVCRRLWILSSKANDFGIE